MGHGHHVVRHDVLDHVHDDVQDGDVAVVRHDLLVQAVVQFSGSFHSRQDNGHKDQTWRSWGKTVGYLDSQN